MSSIHKTGFSQRNDFKKTEDGIYLFTSLKYVTLFIFFEMSSLFAVKHRDGGTPRPMCTFQ